MVIISSFTVYFPSTFAEKTGRRDRQQTADASERDLELEVPMGQRTSRLCARASQREAHPYSSFFVLGSPPSCSKDGDSTQDVNE